MLLDQIQTAGISIRSRPGEPVLVQAEAILTFNDMRAIVNFEIADFKDAVGQWIELGKRKSVAVQSYR